MYRTSTLVAAATAAAAAGYSVGVTTKNNKEGHSKYCHINEFPGMPVVNAAEVVTLPRPPSLPSEPTSKTDMSLAPKSSLKVSSVMERVSQIMRFGFPGLSEVRSRSDYVLSMDKRLRVANWVFEHLTHHNVFGNRDASVDRGKCDFVEDISLHPFFRATNDDYKSSGFDRGHLAAAGNHKQSQDQCAETFLLSNIAPQVGVGFNRDKWEHLEKYTRNLTKLFDNVYVCTGPLYLPKRELDGKNYVKYQVIGKNNVAVPTHFFKVIVCELSSGDLELESYVLPNEAIPNSTPLASFRVNLDSVERAAGLLFFDKIDKTRFKRINGKEQKAIWAS